MAQTPLSQLLTATTLLARAAQWDAARDLLHATQVTPDEEPRVRLALAELAVDQDFAQRTTHSPVALASLAEAVAVHSEPTLAWDFALLQLRTAYFAKLFAAATTPDGLDLEAEDLQTTAPDDVRRAAVTFYRGLIADHFLGNPEEAVKHYTDSLTLCEATGDTLQASYAHRHLGDHAQMAGDLALARAHTERSTELRQQAGHLPGTLAQQVILATLAQAEGHPDAAQAIATETNRWARQLGLTFVVDQTSALMRHE
jgi:tetratricopeptide (TPR) repeat protein